MLIISLYRTVREWCTLGLARAEPNQWEQDLNSELKSSDALE